jgi:hypothetical protein
MTKQEQKLDRLVKLVREHAAAEADADVDATMATVSRTPVYEFYPLGYRMTDWNTIKEYYRMSLVDNQMLKSRIKVVGPSAAFGDQNTSEDIHWFGKNSLVARDDLAALDDDGVLRSLRHYSIFSLDGNLLSGEIMLTTHFGAELMRPIVSKCYETLLGVSIIV